LVAYSGGVDSAYLGLIATEELGSDAVCITGLSPSVSEHQRRQATDIARDFGFNFETIETRELDDPAYAANPANRCYFCKSELYSRLDNIARERAIGVVVDGTNFDDLSDLRHGRAAAREHGVETPLAEIGFTKLDIRERSRELGLSGWERPASPCLASRISPGVPVTIERLGKIERAEDLMRKQGFREFRVRVHGELARVEISEPEIAQGLRPDVRDAIASGLRAIGFRYVTLDLDGFRSGSMNVGQVTDRTNELESI
jgi:uncharacterized protein